MNPHSTETADSPRYETVAWLSISSAILLFPGVVFSILLEIGREPAMLGFLIPYVLLFGLSMAFGLYALYRFKGLLNDRFAFHDVDNLIRAILILGSVMAVVGIGMKVAGSFAKVAVNDPRELIPMAVVMVVFLVLIGLPLAILNIIFAVRLLRLQDDLFGLLKPYAYTTIVASALFATFLLAFLGLFLDAACSIMLGMIFLRASRGAPQPEFV